MSKPFVAILIGSDSDLTVMEAAFGVLDKFDIPFEVKITSAHLAPQNTRDYTGDADRRGCAAFICAADTAAHLAGTVSAATLKPVIGVSLSATAGGLGAPMPGGFPVASVAGGKLGAENAAYLAAQILACTDAELQQKLADERRANAEALITKDAQLQRDLQQRQAK